MKKSKKLPEKIKITKCNRSFLSKYNFNELFLADKINALIDYLKAKEEKI